MVQNAPDRHIHHKDLSGSNPFLTGVKTVYCVTMCMVVCATHKAPSSIC